MAEVSEKERTIAEVVQRWKERMLSRFNAVWHDQEPIAGILAQEAYEAGYRRGIEDAAKVASDAAVEYYASSDQVGDYHYAKTVAANSIAAAIRALGKAEEGTAPR